MRNEKDLRVAISNMSVCRLRKEDNGNLRIDEEGIYIAQDTFKLYFGDAFLNHIGINSDSLFWRNHRFFCTIFLSRIGLFFCKCWKELEKK
jgi:hypothetical protein